MTLYQVAEGGIEKLEHRLIVAYVIIGVMLVICVVLMVKLKHARIDLNRKLGGWDEPK